MNRFWTAPRSSYKLVVVVIITKHKRVNNRFENRLDPQWQENKMCKKYYQNQVIDTANASRPCTHSAYTVHRVIVLYASTYVQDSM